MSKPKWWTKRWEVSERGDISIGEGVRFIAILPALMILCLMKAICVHGPGPTRRMTDWMDRIVDRMEYWLLDRRVK